MSATAEYIKNNCLSLAVPIVILVLFGGYLVYWCVSTLMLCSIGTVGPFENKSLPFGKVTWAKDTEVMIYFYFFGGLWNMAVLGGIGNFIIVASVAMWYYSFSGERKSSGSILKSTGWVFMYHLGTVACASFLTASLWLVQFVLGVLQSSLKTSGQEHSEKGFLLKCAGCCADCIEGYLRFLNKQAYAHTAITSKGYCTSCWQASKIIIKNFLRFSVLQVMVEFLMFFSMVVITVCGVLLNVVIFRYFKEKDHIVMETQIPLIFSGVLAFCVAKAFCSVYETASGSMLYCFCYDENVNGKAQSAPGSLSKAAEKTDRKNAKSNAKSNKYVELN